MDAKKLREALKQRDELGALTQVSAAIEAVQHALRTGLPDILKKVARASGEGTVAQLKRVRAASSMRTAAPVDFAFDVTNPRATEWVKNHSLELIDDLSETTREDIRELLEDAFDGEYDVDQLSDEIDKLIGDDDRAEKIARTETMTASNQGQLEAWDQAVEAGLLTGGESKEWITTPDDRLCPICEPLDGQTVGLNEEFEVDGDMIDAPPAHPNCRCTIGLAV